MADVPLHRYPAVAAGADFDIVMRSLLFLAVLLAVWISFEPFQDLSVPPTALAEAGNIANQVGFASLFLAVAGWTALHGADRLRLLLRPALLLMLAWFVICVITSWEPALSARRLAFVAIVMALAGTMLLLPKNLRHFTDLLTTAVLIVLALCYAGVLLVPDLTIHQVTDVLEPEHAGNWRGLFPHKNQAGGMMAVFVFIGLFVARTRNVVVGALIVALSLAFLIASYSKTSIALLPAVLLISLLLNNVRQPALGLSVAIGGVVLVNSLSIGSIFFDSVRDALAAVIDPSFTGRTDIWQFAVERLAERPITGYGFSAFWGTEHVVFGMRQSSNWASSATDAHNAYLNLALTVGVPGLLLVLVWMLVLPIFDFSRRSGDREEALLALLFLRVWLFVVYVSSFESLLFQPAGELWFLFLMAIFGLRFLSQSRVAP